MKWKKLFSSAAVLGICAAIAKLLGAFFRLPLTNILSAQGMGLYQMVFPLYTVLLTISSGGLASAISKSVAKAHARGSEEDQLKILRVSLVALIIFGAVCTAFLVLFRDQIAYLQGNSGASLAYLGIAPSVVFVSVIACMRGYFQGRGNMLPSGISQIAEQLVKLALGLFFAALFMKRSVEAAVFGAVLGVSASEFVAMTILILQFLYGYYKRKKAMLVPIGIIKNKLEAGEDFVILSDVYQLSLPVITDEIKLTTGEILKSLYKVAIPITLSSLIIPLTQVIDSVLVINMLTGQGIGRIQATSMFGLFSGPISSLINMPLALMLPLSVALLPKLAYLKEKEKENNSKTESSAEVAVKALRITLMLSLPSSIIFISFPNQIITMLYSSGLDIDQRLIAASLLRIEGLSIFYIGLVQVSTAILQGVDMPHKPAINLLYGAVLKVLLTIVLLPILGIKGAAIASVACYGLVATVDLFCVKRTVELRLKPFKALVLPLFSCLIMVLAGFLGFKLFNLFLSPVLSTAAALITSAIFYAATLLLTRAFRIKEFF